MENTIYYDELFSNRRLELIEKCINLQKQGKNFLYILPSREAMKEVRKEILEQNKGVIGSNIIMFDELEAMLTLDTSKHSTIIEPNCEKVILKKVCEDDEIALSYYDKIKGKEGFQNEVRIFIKYLKRNLISEEKLQEIIDKIQDEILKKKLVDISLIYTRYNKFLKDNYLCDVNDISLLATKEAKSTKLFDKYAAIVIDGFLNIDKVNQELIKEISKTFDIDIFINCPYKTEFTDEFLSKEMIDTFKNMSFEINEESFNKIDGVESDTTEIAKRLFTSSKGEGAFNNIKIIEYPSIKAEIIYTAKKIKKLLMDGVEIENIAIYINNKEAYEAEISRTFSQYKIPINMSYDMPLSSYKVARDLLENLDTLPEELKVNEGLTFIQNYIDSYYKQIATTLQKDDIAVANNLKELLNSVESTFNSMSLLDENMLKEDFISIFEDNLKEAKVTLNKANRAGLAILNTDLAKGIYFDYIFVLGLNEGEVPVVPKAGGLFNEVELKALKDNSITYKDWNWELHREKMRFILTLASGKKEITLSYRNVNEDGKFAIGSQFIDAVKFITQKKSNEKVTIREYVEFPSDSSMSEMELHKALLQEDVQYDGSTLSKHIDNSKVENFKLNGKIEFERKNEADFTKYEGVITSDEYLDCQDKYIGKLWFKNLESYIKCPMGFMFSKIYNIDKYGDNNKEEGISNLDKTIFYKGALSEYYNKASEYENIQEDLLNEAIENKVNDLVKKYQTLNKESEEVIALKSSITKFLEEDIKLRCKFNKQQENKLKPYLVDMCHWINIDGIDIGISIDRVELEYKVEGERDIPTGRYIVYCYRNNLGYEITCDNLIKLDTIEPALIYKATEEILKEKFLDVTFQCLGVLFLSVEKAKRDGIYINDLSSSIFSRNRTKGTSSDKLPIIMEHGYKHAINIVKDIKTGIYNYNINCNEEKSYSDYKCVYMNLCRYYKSKGEVKNNV